MSSDTKHNHLTRDIKALGKCPACDTTRRLMMKKPEPKLSRAKLVQWLEAHGDKDARKKFVDNAFDPKAKKLTKDEVYDIAIASYDRTQAAAAAAEAAE